MAEPTTTSNLNQNFVVTIGNQPYYIEIFLYNALKSDGYEPFQLSFKNVDELSIEESLMTWIVKGYIILNSDFEILERGALAVVNQQTNTNNPLIKAPYVFRTDGRNKISFRIKPLLDNTQYLDKDWEMSFDCVIYDIEDLDADDNGRKYRKYYFWDERYQILTERNIEYSSIYSNPNFIPTTDPSKLPKDKERAYNPNLMLKDIITTAASNPAVMVKGITNTPNSIKVGFNYYKGESISDPKQPMASFDDGANNSSSNNWDNGSQSNLYIYTSPSNSKAIDDISIVLDHCISNKRKGPVFLRFGRTTEDKTWKLISLESLFSNSAAYQTERLFIEDGIQSSTPYIPRSWDAPQGNNVNYVSPMGSRIQNYKYSPMVAADDAKQTNSPVHHYDFNSGTYSVTFTDNTALSVKDNMQENAKLGLFNFSSTNTNSSNAHIVLNVNQSKTNGTILENVHVSSTFFPPNYAGNKMLKDALFLNNAISFDVNGITLRTAGKFIFIDRFSSSTSNPFDDRFLGQWLTVKVNHIFTKNSYINNICAVKVDTNKQLWTQKDTTI